MKVSQAFITLAVLVIAVFVFSGITQSTLADKYANPDPVEISWQEEILPNGKTSLKVHSSTDGNKGQSSSKPSETQSSEDLTTSIITEPTSDIESTEITESIEADTSSSENVESPESTESVESTESPEGVESEVVDDSSSTEDSEPAR